ncbi:cation:proton antiporter [Nocardioides limicola]|uniref:cation:proton antiporter n=1 Tax=Nocardioides limicola TaxID=2803368 RepID=UPI00193C6555|nr:cation:proton antiporter [Nocardioides sp. DJM-14]
MNGSSFEELTILLLLGAAVGLVGLMLRQPLIVSFIAAGLIAGPSGLDLVGDSAQIHALAKLGIALLLFLVGLNLDLGLIRRFGRVAALTGLGQVLFTSVIGFSICLALGMSVVTSAYVAVALTFSSTIIIVKLLSDKRELDSLHGRIALGFLIVQDLVVVVAMAVLATVGAAGGNEGAEALIRVGAGAVALLAVAALFMRYLAEPILARISRSQELLVLFALAWAASFAMAADYLGLSMELGGLVAGVSLGSTSFRDAIASRLSSLRDFLLLFFFLELGSMLDLGLIGDQLPAAILLSLFVLVGNPFIVMVIMGVMGYRRRTGFLAGLTVAQISEFSLVFVAMGLTLGHIGVEAVGLTTVVGLITIGTSTYMILYSASLYARLERWLGPFERRNPVREDRHEEPDDLPVVDTVLFGLGRYGTALVEELHARGRTLLCVDFDPTAVRHAAAAGIPAVYGDVTDPDFPASLPLHTARWVVSTIAHPHGPLAGPDPQSALVEALRTHGFSGRIALTATSPAQARVLGELRPDVLLTPFIDGAATGADKLG